MVDATYIDNDRIQVVKDSDIAFDTDRPSVTLFPDSYRIAVTDFQIVFPSFIQARAYFRDAIASGSLCELWSTVFWQEWGPDETYHNENYYPGAPHQSIPGPTRRNLPQQLLGSIPPEASFLDIRVRLRRIKTPANWLNTQPPPPLFKLNEWITLPGGSCPVENFRRTQRMFNIVRVGSNVYLRRYQSVVNSNSTAAPFGNPQINLNTGSGWNSDANKLAGVNTYSDGTAATQLNPRCNTEVAALINARGPANDGNDRRPNGSDPCRGGWPDLGSTYEADIIITPGIYRPAT